MRNTQHVAAIRAVDGHLVLSTMVYSDEIVNPSAIDEFEHLDGIEISDRERKMASQLVDSLAGAFEPDKFHDEYREQVLDLIGKKAAGEELVAPEPAATAPKVVDLLAALEASVKAAKESRANHPTARKAAKRSATEPEAEEAAPVRARRKKSA
jgi:DNA end-binding protein Ku